MKSKEMKKTEAENTEILKPERFYYLWEQRDTR